MRREYEAVGVPARARPTSVRAAAAARLAGAPSGPEAVARRMKDAAHRSRTYSAQAYSALTPAISGAAALAVAPAPAPRPLARPEEQPRPRHLKLVPEGLTPAQRGRRARALLIAGIGVAAMIGLALVYFHVVLAQRQFALDKLQNQVQQAQTTYQSQRLQVAQLGSPAQIISRAEGQLGMVQPTNVSYLTPSGTTAGSGQTAKAPLGRIGAPVEPASQAPAGDANWPTIKSEVAGIP